MKMEIQQSCALTTLPPASPLQRRPVCGKEGNVGYHPTHRRLESYNMQIQKYRKILLNTKTKKTFITCKYHWMDVKVRYFYVI